MKRFAFKGLQRERKCQHYPVKLLGSVLCSHPGVDEICRAMADMYSVSRQKIEKLPLYNLTVSPDGITFVNVSNVTESLPKKFVIKRVVYCGVDKQHQKIFAFFYRSPESIYGGLDCYVVECRSKRHAKSIALKISEIFQGMASETQDENREHSLPKLNMAHGRTVSTIQLHMSVESLSDEETCATPLLQRQQSNPHERKLNYSELQLHSNKCENNSSGYGDSSDDLSNETSFEMKHRKCESSVQEIHCGESSQTGLVKRDYVNAGITKSRGFRKKHSQPICNNVTAQTFGLTEIKEWDLTRKDRNANSPELKTSRHEYININIKKPGVFV